MASNLLITGGTGLFGSALIEHYLKHEPDTNIIVLVRGNNTTNVTARLYSIIQNSPSFPPALTNRLPGRVQVLAGDFTERDFGLDKPIRLKLFQNVTDIVHSGASVDFGLPLEDARNVNVNGTDNVIRFALRCSKLDSFLHISTGHVAGKRKGIIREHDIGTEQGFFNSYEQTKAEAELLIRRYMDSFPAIILRLTTIIGDYAGGHVRQFGFFHNSLRLLSQGIIPYLPGDPKGHLDLIPTEYPVRAVHHLHKKNFRPGTTYHICCGPERSFTLEDFLYETIAHFNKRSGNSVECPVLIEEEEFGSRTPQTINPRVNSVMKALGTFIGHLALPKIFDQTNSKRDLAGSGIDPPPIRSYYFKVLDDCLKKKFGKNVYTRRP